MTTYVPTIPDIDASMDVLVDVGEISDSLTVEQAVDYKAAVERVIKRAKDTLALLDSHLVKTLESPIIRDGFQYEVKPKKEKQRWDHGRIAAGVQQRARYTGDGEIIEDNDEVVRRAVDFMRRIYLSDSSSAKVTVLEELGFRREDLETFLWGGKEVVVIPTHVLPTNQKEKQ